jgi:SlyX protein
MDQRLERAEEQIAHLARIVEDLSDVVARQSGEIDLLTRRMAILMERAAERESEAGAVVLADERPPHY